MRLTGTREASKRAKRLRREMSPPEVYLWQVLRKRPGGHKFRHQHPLDGFVLDFFCHASSIAVEVDGNAHDFGDQPRFDEGRDAALAEHGIETLRIPARHVYRDMEAVVQWIVARADERRQFAAESPNGLPVPLRRAFGAPPPPEGEE